MAYVVISLAEAYRAMKKIAPGYEEWSTFSRLYFSIFNGMPLSKALMKARQEKGDFKKIAEMVRTYLRYSNPKDIRFSVYPDALVLNGFYVYQMTETDTGYTLGNDIYITKTYQGSLDRNVYIEQAITIMAFASSYQRLASTFPNKFPDMPRVIAFGDHINSPEPSIEDPLYMGYHSLQGGLGPFPFVFEEGVHTEANPPFTEDLIEKTAQTLIETIDKGYSFTVTIVVPDWADTPGVMILDEILAIDSRMTREIFKPKQEGYTYMYYDPSKDAPTEISPPFASRVYRYQQ